MLDDTTEIDSGMDVLDSHGEEVGTVANVDDDIAYVDLNPDLTDELRAQLGFGDTDKDTYALRDEMVDTVDDDGVHLHGEH